MKNKYELNIKENYIDIKYYLKLISIDRIKIELLLYEKKMIINGKDLLIICMDEYEIIVKGNIYSIQFTNE